MHVEIFVYGIGVAEGISKGVKEPCLVRVLSVEDYRYGISLGVQFW
jgi:hypothetical protein